MGKIPDTNLIIKNIGEIHVDMTENDQDANEIVSEVASNLDLMEENIKSLKAEKAKTLKKIERDKTQVQKQTLCFQIKV